MPATIDNNPPVTWLLSVKNNMPFLAETLRSIAEQTYRNHKILAWDDCSTDGSLEELQKWIPAVIPGKIFSGKSLRLGPCLAFLVEQADTELCARIDGDDIAVPHRLEKQVRYMLDHPEVAVLGSRMQVIDENGNELPSWAHPVDEAEINWDALGSEDSSSHATLSTQRDTRGRQLSRFQSGRFRAVGPHGLEYQDPQPSGSAVEVPPFYGEPDGND